ncbi:unnamed protein product [Symbiodinium natans]|uniref:Uncharacterized protein n=1 Tax=Symbiodinium natans TaxID=878477 RepID=A0A812I3I3_9DINO|nr:unnamed protein product [Symbiodinium natans]
MERPNTFVPKGEVHDLIVSCLHFTDALPLRAASTAHVKSADACGDIQDYLKWRLPSSSSSVAVSGGPTKLLLSAMGHSRWKISKKRSGVFDVESDEVEVPFRWLHLGRKCARTGLSGFGGLGV